MAKFSHLKELAPQESVWMDSQYLEGVRFLVSPALEANKEFYNEVFRKANKMRGKVMKGDPVKRGREDDRELYPKHIIKGWEGVVDDKGKEVKFNEQDCKDFVDQLPDYVFDDIRVFCGNIKNFIESPIDVEEVAKN